MLNAYTKNICRYHVVITPVIQNRPIFCPGVPFAYRPTLLRVIFNFVLLFSQQLSGHLYILWQFHFLLPFTPEYRSARWPRSRRLGLETYPRGLVSVTRLERIGQRISLGLEGIRANPWHIAIGHIGLTPWQHQTVSGTRDSFKTNLVKLWRAYSTDSFNVA